MTDVPNPLNIRNVRLIAGGPGGQKARAMFGKQALQMLKQGHLANSQLPQWRMRRFVSDDKGNIILINIKSIFGLDTIEFIFPPELPEMQREEKTEHVRKTSVPGARQEFFPAIRVFALSGAQIGIIISREADKWGPPWDLIMLPEDSSGNQQTETEAGFVDWRMGQWSRQDAPYEARTVPYITPDPQWATAIDISIPDFKDELWIYQDMIPDHDEMFLEVDYEKIDPVHTNQPPLPGYKYDWSGSYYYHYHQPIGFHVYVSGVKPAIYNYGSYYRTGIALHTDSQLFKELLARNQISGTALCCNFQWLTLEEVWSEDLTRDDDWERVHDPLEGHPEWIQKVPSFDNIGWWFTVGTFDYRVGTTLEHEISYVIEGPRMYFLSLFGTWSSRGYGVFQVYQHPTYVATGIREFFPADINNFPWDSTSITKDNPCLQVYPHTCGLLSDELEAEITVERDSFSWEEFFEIDGVMYSLNSGSLTPPSSYSSTPGVRANNTHPRYFDIGEDRVCAILGLRRHTFHTFEYYYWNTNPVKDTFEFDRIDFPGYTYIDAGSEESNFMHLVTGDIFHNGETYNEALFANGTTRLIRKTVLEKLLEEQAIRFDGQGVPQFSTVPGQE